MRRRAALAIVAVVPLALVSCSDDDDGDDTSATTLVGGSSSEQFPDIIGVEPAFDAESGQWSFAVTVSSPYDTPERYADGWRVVGPDGTVYGVHTLAHDHANEQPFTRRQSGVEIPDDVEQVTIEGRDQANGFGGATITLDLTTMRP